MVLWVELPRTSTALNCSHGRCESHRRRARRRVLRQSDYRIAFAPAAAFLTPTLERAVSSSGGWWPAWPELADRAFKFTLDIYSARAAEGPTDRTSATCGNDPSSGNCTISTSPSGGSCC